MASSVIILSAILMFIVVCAADIYVQAQGFGRVEIYTGTKRAQVVPYNINYLPLKIPLKYVQPFERIQQYKIFPPVTEVCLGCICQAASGCKQGTGCEADGACGLFRITQPYWIDAGKPTLNGEPDTAPSAFQNCAIDPYCAALTVQGYMKRFPQDCNGDGQVNCYDYLAIHKKGGYGCVGELPYNYVSVFNQCVAAVAAQQGYQG